MKPIQFCERWPWSATEEKWRLIPTWDPIMQAPDDAFFTLLVCHGRIEYANWISVKDRNLSSEFMEECRRYLRWVVCEQINANVPSPKLEYDETYTIL